MFESFSRFRKVTRDATARAIVISAPPAHRALLANRSGVSRTFAALMSLLAEARRSVHVFSPYVDPTFTALLHSVDPTVAIRVVTTARDGRMRRPSAVLERCSQDRDLKVRYVVEHRHKAQMFQMHAKLVSVDGVAAYLGSANLTDTSIHYNLELGIVTRVPEELKQLERLFAYVWQEMGVPAARL